jgi:ankyrin repeat protein
VVEYLLKHGAQLKVTGRVKQTPLQLAAYIGYADVAKVLLDNKADIDERGPWGETALHWAAVRGNTDIAGLLLERGANVNIQTSGATIDLNFIPSDETIDTIENELRWFRTCEEMENAKKLGIGLQVMGPIKLAFAKGDTPIHAAAYWNHPDIVKMLIAKGADVNKTNGLGETALHYAAVCRYLDVAQILLDSGANPKAKTNKGMTPIDISREVKYQKLIKLLSGM